MSPRLYTFAALMVGLSACSPKAPTPDTATTGLCFSGGPIYTAIDETPTVEVVAVEGDMITYAGAQKDGWCTENAGLHPRHINLAGRALYPGFTDAHGHLLGIGLREMTLNLEGTQSVSELQERIQKVLKDVPPGETLYGRGWIETHWPEGRFPNRSDLDAIAPNNPLIMERADGHASVVNSAALKAAGITADTEPPFGGDILKDENGEPTGMLIDNAAGLVADLMPKLTEARKRSAFKKGSELYASRGWANVHSMSVRADNVTLMEDLSAKGDLNIRVYNSLDIKGPEDIKALAARADNTDRITSKAVKLYADGALGSRGAALHAPYSDDPGNRGLMLITKKKIMPILEAALENGIQVNTHAIGDRANTRLLNWYEEALGETDKDHRWRIEHAQILTMPDLKRFQSLGVMPSMQPSHAIGDLHFAPARLGHERLAGGYAWNSLIENGNIIAGGSDAPVEIGDPRIEFYAAVERKDLKGFSNQDWYRNERVSRQDALKMFTIWAAHAAFQEDDLGTIEVGKKADFTSFDKDIMTIPAPDILEVTPIMTVVAGDVVFEAK